MSSKFSLVRGRKMRATALDGCGDPVPGSRNVITTDGFISVGLTANNEEADEISVTNAAGRVCILDSPTSKFQNYSVQIQFCGVDPELITMMTGQPVVLDGQGGIVGFQQDTEVDVDLVGFALELWAGVPFDVCEEGADVTYGYILLPFIKGGSLGDFTVENAAINFTMTGGVTKGGAGWAAGPHDVVLDNGGNPSPLLQPLTKGVHLHVQQTQVAPPADGTTALGTLATGADAGTPGEWTPANSYGPADLAALQASGITANPGTAWTTGQHVVLEDGSKAHWDGTAWVAGEAP